MNLRWLKRKTEFGNFVLQAKDDNGNWQDVVCEEEKPEQQEKLWETIRKIWRRNTLIESSDYKNEYLVSIYKEVAKAAIQWFLEQLPSELEIESIAMKHCKIGAGWAESISKPILNAIKSKLKEELK